MYSDSASDQGLLGHERQFGDNSCVLQILVHPNDLVAGISNGNFPAYSEASHVGIQNKHKEDTGCSRYWKA